MDINPILEKLRKEKDTVKRLQDELMRFAEINYNLQEKLARLEQAKLKVCSVQLVKKDYEQVIQILGVHETPDGLIIRVAE